MIGGVPALEAVFSYSGGGFELQQAAMTVDLPVVLDPRLRTG